MVINSQHTYIYDTERHAYACRKKVGKNQFFITIHSKNTEESLSFDIENY
jgi:hypothetical protein